MVAAGGHTVAAVGFVGGADGGVVAAARDGSEGDAACSAVDPVDGG